MVDMKTGLGLTNMPQIEFIKLGSSWSLSIKTNDKDHHGSILVYFEAKLMIDDKLEPQYRLFDNEIRL